MIFSQIKIKSNHMLNYLLPDDFNVIKEYITNATDTSNIDALLKRNKFCHVVMPNYAPM